MAYCRLGHIKENKGKGGVSKGLKACLEYIYNPEKTNGLDVTYVGGYNMDLDYSNITESAYKSMIATKESFDKPMGRQGYHYKLSFPSTDKVTPELALKITNEFCEKVFKNYECAYAVHDNTEHLHSHIVINSIDMIEGYKYHYKKGDWAKTIMPIANEICKKYNLSALDLNIDEDVRLQHKCKSYAKWTADKKKNKDKRLNYTNSMIKCDVDEAINKANDFDEFVHILQDKGHIVDTSGKYITVKAPGRERPCRLYNLTQDKQTYTKSNIEKMIKGTFQSREEVCNRLMSDWVTYDNTKNRKIIKGLSKQMAIYFENQLFIEEKHIITMDDLVTYKEYLNCADKELNIMRKYINRSLDAKREVFEKLDTILLNIQAYNKYKSTNENIYKEGYDKVVSLYKELDDAGYSMSALFKYRYLGESLIKNINDYKKHIFVERKICERIERSIYNDMKNKKI